MEEEASLMEDLEPPSCSHDSFRNRFYRDVTDAEWNNWRWQLKNRITRFDELEKFLILSDEEREFNMHSKTMFPVAITPYYMGLIDRENSKQALRRTMIPIVDECFHSEQESEDPLNEDADSPVSGIVHRYPDRVLFLVIDFCSAYCRYCTRSRIVGSRKTHKLDPMRWQKGIDYIKEHPEIRDVLISGGDPLTLSSNGLEWLLSNLRKIPHVEIIRIGTKVPVVLPQRINNDLIRVLKKYHPLFMSIHFTHPDELTPETQAACKKLADAGIPLGSQTVLLAGINDNVDTMKQLYHGLLKIRVRPYYLYQCDPIVGSAHFRTPVRKGIEIIEGLRGHTSGYAIPNYVIDGPGGAGKIPLLPEYVVGYEGNDLLLRNYEGQICRYPDKFENKISM